MRWHISPISVDGTVSQPQQNVQVLHPAGPSRIANIDRLRILAAVGIVWFHTEGAPGRRIGYAGLPIFLLVFFSLITIHSETERTTTFLKRRWDRLVKPWLFWSVVYGMCKLVNAVRMGEANPLHDILSAKVLVTGTSIHLWYLPYAFVLGFMAHVVGRRAAQTRPIGTTLLAAAVGILTLIGGAVGVSGYLSTEPFPQWAFGLAALPLGYAIGKCVTLPQSGIRKPLLLAICLAASATCLLLSLTGHAGLGIPYGISLVLVCLAYFRHGHADVLVAKVAPLTFGIYLIHPLVAYGMSILFPSNPHYTVLIGANVCVSALLTLGLRETPVRRFV
jgi:peptidoglycan/LPS O-acetylase OafA/YrhL